MTETLPRSAIEPKNPLLNASRSSNLPHVPGVRVGDYIFLSGMAPIDPRTGEQWTHRRAGPHDLVQYAAPAGVRGLLA
jgi:enamine deaminase RidA (YjgF/YER057c/UK114 family)